MQLYSASRGANQNEAWFHTHKFNPKMLCHRRELTVGRVKNKKKEKREEENSLRKRHFSTYI